LAEADRNIRQQLWRFLLVGGLAFAIDVAVMALLVYGFAVADSQQELIVCRMIAWAVAVTAAFFANAKVTFGASIRHSRFFSYLLIQAIGGLINLGCYSVLILGPLSDWPIAALVIGSALATVSNFLLVRKFVYRFHPSLTEPEL